jgi:hypothetical protein
MNEKEYKKQMKEKINLLEKCRKIELKMYPEELTENQTDNFDCKNFSESSSYAEDYKKAVAYAKKIKGQVYTMVDGENNHTYYLKGLHWVNRFGFCVLKKERVKNVEKQKT